MNAPFFNTKNLKSPFGSAAWMGDIIAEEKRCCGTIDARINKLRDERIALGEEFAAVQEQLETEQGFFARLRLTFKLRNINKQMEWRRLALSELFDARITRTYA